MLNVIKLSIVMLSVVMLNVIILSVIVLSVVMLSAVMLNVVEPRTEPAKRGNAMEQSVLKNVGNCWNTKHNFYLDTRDLIHNPSFSFSLSN